MIFRKRAHERIDTTLAQTQFHEALLNRKHSEYSVTLFYNLIEPYLRLTGIGWDVNGKVWGNKRIKSLATGVNPGYP